MGACDCPPGSILADAVLMVPSMHDFSARDSGFLMSGCQVLTVFPSNAHLDVVRVRMLNPKKSIMA
jgi:hypothetical protein